MKRMRTAIVAVLIGGFLGGCAVGYTLVAPNQTSVAKGTMKVKPSVSWNKAPKNFYAIPQEENWTQNGPLLDSLTFVGGVKDGEALAKQRPKDDRKVPVFRPGMSPQDLVSMVESLYRIKAGATVFETTGVKPATFLGAQGVQFDYTYVGNDEVKRRGRSVFAIIDGQLYLVALDGAAVHYFDAALPEFEAIVASATRS
jgi:hypothetical protein